MVDLTATLFKAIINDSKISDENAENLIDLAIAEVALRSDRDLSLMGGTAGSKTVSLELREYAAVMEAARAIYSGFYKGVKTTSAGGVTVSRRDLKGDPQVDAQIENAARLLAEFDVDYG